mmetsp:Transcript_87139/g.281426  ORF Transcript_87139/g.281426 Transcript_87139/m.281426 type:complete len:287 (+) Transcript_87139:2587-3447(+)
MPRRSTASRSCLRAAGKQLRSCRSTWTTAASARMLGPSRHRAICSTARAPSVILAFRTCRTRRAARMLWTSTSPWAESRRGLCSNLCNAPAKTCRPRVPSSQWSWSSSCTSTSCPRRPPLASGLATTRCCPSGRSSSATRSWSTSPRVRCDSNCRPSPRATSPRTSWGMRTFASRPCWSARRRAPTRRSVARSPSRRRAMPGCRSPRWSTRRGGGRRSCRSWSPTGSAAGTRSARAHRQRRHRARSARWSLRASRAPRRRWSCTSSPSRASCRCFPRRRLSTFSPT